MPKNLQTFLKAQLSAFLGGLFDFGIYSICHISLNISAPISNIISGGLGAVVNFSINRYWSFDNKAKSVKSQLWKFVLVVLGSISLKSAGIYLLVTLLDVHFLLGKLIVELIVSLGFNYTLQRYWVFRK